MSQLNKKLTSPKPQFESLQLNYNPEKNKYFLINNKTGEETYIQNTGEHIKKFNASLTGQAGYNERIAQAKNPQEMPYRAKSLTIVPKQMFYTPKIDKFTNYMQNPNELVKPYYNKKFQPLASNKQKISNKIEIIKQQKNFLNKFNQNALKNKEQLQNLTGTICDKKLNEETNELRILKHRNGTKTLPLSEYSHLNATKIINGTLSKHPNETFLRTQLQKIQQSSETEQSAASQYDTKFEEAKKQFNNKISDTRFTSKAKCPSNTTSLFPPKRSATFQPDAIEIHNYYRKHTNLHRTPSELLPLVTQFATTTFQKEIKLGYEKELRPDTVIGLQYYEKNLEKQKLELQNWKQVEGYQEKKRVCTKNRFNSAIPDCAAFNLADRQLYQTVFPQPKEKILKNKRLFIDPITGKTLINPPKAVKSASTTALNAQNTQF